MTDTNGGVKSSAVNYDSPPQSCPKCGCGDLTRRCRASAPFIAEARRQGLLPDGGDQ